MNDIIVTIVLSLFLDAPKLSSSLSMPPPSGLENCLTSDFLETTTQLAMQLSSSCCVDLIAFKKPQLSIVYMHWENLSPHDLYHSDHPLQWNSTLVGIIQFIKWVVTHSYIWYEDEMHIWYSKRRTSLSVWLSQQWNSNSHNSLHEQINWTFPCLQ